MKHLRRYIGARERILLVGPPGIGKTARVLAAANAEGLRLVNMRASLCERVDFGGALVPDMKAGLTRALPLDTLADLRATKKPTLLFLDDLGQAPMDVQAALMVLFDQGGVSDNVLIWGATNRPGDVAGVTRLCEPLRSRFSLAFSIATPEQKSDAPDGGVMFGTWEDEVASWCGWALDNDVAPEIIAWHRATNGRTLYAWRPCADPSVRMPDYRAWATVARLWAAGLRGLDDVAAAIGKPAAAEFVAFARLADKLPTPDQVWLDPKGAIVPEEPAALYLVASSLAASAKMQHARALVTYLARMPRVYGALLGRDAHRRLGATLSGCKEWVAWYTANQELFGLDG